jgi:predicted ATPase
MLKQLRLINFKAFSDSGKIPLKPLTIIVGPNNAGKSALFHALLLLKQTLEDKNRERALITSGPVVELGSFHDIITGGRQGGRRTVKISVKTSASASGFFAADSLGKSPESASLSVSFTFDSKANRIKVSSAKLQQDRRILISVQRAGKGWAAPSIAQDVRKHLEVAFAHFIPTVAPTGEAPQSRKLATKVLQTMFLSEARAHGWMQVFQGVRHMAPLRLPVPWYGVAGRMPSSELGPGGENLLRVLATQEQKPSLISQVRSWITKEFLMLQDLRLVKLDPAGTVLALKGDEIDGFGEINVAAMGEGISQLLPIVARVLLTQGEECLLVEQPELHLHPKAQADLADLFLGQVRRQPKAQIIVETHSEHLLLRIRRRIAEGSVEQGSVMVLFVEKKEGRSQVTSLPINGRGHFEEWPKDFFEEGYQEALALAEAAGKSG